MPTQAQNVEITLTSVPGVAMLMHADNLVDPLDPKTKEFRRISGKRKKTDADYEEMSRLEFLSALYVGMDGDIVIPYKNLKRSLIAGGTITRSGVKIERGFDVRAAEFRLDFEGPRDPEAMYADGRFTSRMSVVVGKAKTMRTRPIFRKWSLIAHAMIDPAVLSAEELQDIVDDAGQMIGLGTYRARGGYGRFDGTVEVQ